MSGIYKIAVLAGSLRQEAYSRKLADILMKNAPGNLRFEHVEIGDLPLYNEDLETANPPVAWARLRKQIAAVQGICFCYAGI